MMSASSSSRRDGQFQSSAWLSIGSFPYFHGQLLLSFRLLAFGYIDSARCFYLLAINIAYAHSSDDCFYRHGIRFSKWNGDHFVALCPFWLFCSIDHMSAMMRRV
eukprot:scaffold204582_cov18-Prasinocladus_malaysianus.AAC.1